WHTRERVRPSDGATLRVSETYRYDCPRQLRVATLRYEVIRDGAVVQAVERPWVLRWYLQEEFRDLLDHAGLRTDVIIADNGRPAAKDAAAFAFVAQRPAGSV